MSEHQNEPREYDAVKGGQNPPPISAAVLGGIPSIKSRLASPTVYVRAAALPEALKYGEAGLDLIIQALHDQIVSVRFAAYLLLKDRDEEKIKQYLRNYDASDFDVIIEDAYGEGNSSANSFAFFFPQLIPKSPTS